MTAAVSRAPRRVPPRVWWLTAGAVLLYGAIAAFANRAHGVGPMQRAALVQGLSCGVTTFGLSTLIDGGVAWMRRSGFQQRTGGALVALSAATLGCALHVAANVWAGTPELLSTVAVPAVALAVYCPLYAAAASRRLP